LFPIFLLLIIITSLEIKPFGFRSFEKDNSHFKLFFAKV
jgi:hypothetical protein